MTFSVRTASSPSLGHAELVNPLPQDGEGQIDVLGRIGRDPLALVQLLRRFTPEYVGPTPAKIRATVTLCPQGGLPFRIRELS